MKGNEYLMLNAYVFFNILIYKYSLRRLFKSQIDWSISEIPTRHKAAAICTLFFFFLLANARLSVGLSVGHPPITDQFLIFHSGERENNYSHLSCARRINQKCSFCPFSRAHSGHIHRPRLVCVRVQERKRHSVFSHRICINCLRPNIFSSVGEKKSFIDDARLPQVSTFCVFFFCGSIMIFTYI